MSLPKELKEKIEALAEETFNFVTSNKTSPEEGFEAGASLS